MSRLRFLVFACLTLQVVSGVDPSLTIEPNSILKAVGEGAYVSCKAVVDDPDLVTEMSWTGPNGDKITPDGQSVTTAEDGTPGNLDLVITTLEERDVGQYTCTATYAGNQNLEASVMVESYKKIDFGDTSEHQKLLIGQEGKIKCKPTAVPSPTVEWFKNRDRFEIDDTHIIQQDGILITEVTEADEGIYRCRAKVIPLGSIKQIEIQVEVNIPPTINVPPANTTGKEHGEATFQCSAIGKPTPVYTWVDNYNAPLENGDDIHVNSDTGVLTLMNLKPDQTGEYRCTASNSAGDDTQTALLQVFTEPKVEEFLNITVNEGDKAELRCAMSGSPTPMAVFKKESEPGNFSKGINADDRIFVKNEKDDQGREVGILEITNVNRGDDGLYTCTALSDGGVTQRWGHITVQFKPTFEEQTMNEFWSWEQGPVNLTCLATSIPNATVSWYFNNEEIDVNDVNLKILSFRTFGVLRVNPVSSSYFGYYTCKATNDLGQNTYDLELKQAHLPGPIISAKVDKKTATTISWGLVDPANNGGLPIQSYIVEYRKTEHSWENPSRKTWNKGSSYTIDNLEPKTTYVFRFAAQTKVGIGEWGGEKVEEMPGHSQPEEPLIFAGANNINPYPNYYVLQWKVPLDNGKEIDYFQIVYYQVEKKGEDWEPVGDKTTREVKSPGKSQFKIENLQSDSHYKIELRAHNEIGYSTPAETYIKTAPGPVQPTPSQSAGSNTGVIVGVLIILVLLIAILVDVTCYCTRKAGLTATILSRRTQKDKDKEVMLEDGKNGCEEKHEGNGQTKTEKDDLKAEQEKSDKKESTEPTETTPMIQGDNDDKIDIKKEEKEEENLKTSES